VEHGLISDLGRKALKKKVADKDYTQTKSFSSFFRRPLQFFNLANYCVDLRVYFVLILYDYLSICTSTSRPEKVRKKDANNFVAID